MFWRVQAAVWTAFAAAGFGLFALWFRVLPVPVALRLFPVEALLGVLFTGLLREAYRRLPVVRRREPGVRGAVAVAAMCSGTGVLWVALEQPLLRLLGVAAMVRAMDPRPAFETSPLRELVPNVFFSAGVLAAWSFAYLGVSARGEAAREAAERARADALARDAQLAMLRYQLNPHFLFNALNSVAALVLEDPPRAHRMVLELSRFLRQTLLPDAGDLVPLRDEVRLVRSYLALEQVRFEEHLQVDVAIDPAAEAVLVPSFILQPLVENALKHGPARGAPLRVRVEADAPAGALRMRVANTGALERPLAPGRGGVGLANVRARLDGAFGGRGRLSLDEADGWVRATIAVSPAEAS